MKPTRASYSLSILFGVAGSALSAQSSEDLAKKLSNPVADLISLPFQLNYDEGFGADGSGSRTQVNVQPVIPFSLNENWNIISRTIVPLTYNEGIVGDDTEFGVGNVIQSFFFSPKEPTKRGWIWGIGPVIQIPLSTDDQFGIDDWGVGPTAVVLKQTGPWTFGGLANHVWDVGGSSDINATFFQPFLSFTTPNAVTYTVNSESTYDWEAENWSIPLNFLISKVIPISGRPVSVQGGIRYWADSDDTGPDDFGLRFNVTYLFPR
ncbi:MAG: transporter [Pseudomonadota bacterium]